MASSLIIKDTYPAKDFTSITQTGLKAYNLANTHRPEIDARLPGTLDALGADLETFGAAVPGTVQARHEAQAATTTQNAVLKKGYAQVRAIRATVRKTTTKKEVRRAYGIGQVTNPKVVRDVTAAIQQIVDRAAQAPQEAAEFGLSDAAIAALKTFLASLTDADVTQEKKRAHAPLSTKQRNVTANRILNAAVLVAGAGMLAFADDPVTHASFDALMESTKKTKAAKATKPPAPPEVPERSTGPASASSAAGPASA
jgi:hypothetical protein